MSEIMLQKSISASSLVKQAAAAVQAQQASAILVTRRTDRPTFSRAVSDFVTSSVSSQTISQESIDYLSSRSTSGLQTPDPCERRHIRFDDKVEQCIAVDCKEGDDDDGNADCWHPKEDDSSDDGIVMMKKSRKKRPLSRANSKSNLSAESKTIAKLPSTTLKYRTESPNVRAQKSCSSLEGWRPSTLSSSASQETLRPPNPATNFLLSEEDDDDLVPWVSSETFDQAHSGAGVGWEVNAHRLSTDHTIQNSSGLRRTESGMFMPYGDEVEDHSANSGIFGKVIETVNTARDIAHVIWNVGWRN